MNDKMSVILKGIAMGMAEVIPGVSGGTIAFITGIYQRLLNAIKEIDGKALRLLISGKWKEFMNKIDGYFLLFLLTGMATGLLSGVFIITYLIKNHIEPLWGFFTGLIIASAIYIAKMIKKWNLTRFLFLLLGILIAYFIVVMHPLQGSRAYWYVFLSGLIAISALIMPGISGSFMLLILGMYTIIIPEVKHLLTTGSIDSLLLLVVFALGMLTGLFTFARIMSWAFKHHEQNTLVLLTGFMIGSLYKIWPWRMPVTWIDKHTGKIFSQIDNIKDFSQSDITVLSDKPVLPQDYTIGDPQTAIVILAAVIGFAIVFLLERYQNKKPEQK